jgi:ribosomal protein S6--L-glutamate ligase
MRIAFLLVRHPPSRPSPVFPEVVRLLRARGDEVELLYPDDQYAELRALRVDHDLYVLKSGSETALSMAGALHALGATIINPYPISAMCRDKIVASGILEASGVPTPETYVASDPGQLEPLLERGPLVLKPHRGSQGRGVHVVRHRSELERMPANGEPFFAQRYHAPDGLDRKIYCIGNRVFGVERVWPARTYQEKLGRPVEVDNEIREIALRVGAAFGLGLFGFDVVLSNGRPYVVDLSSFPGFKGVPDAALHLAVYIHSAARHAASAETLIADLVGPEWVRA